MKTPEDIIHEILQKNKEELNLSRQEMNDLFGTEDPDEIRDLIPALINLQLLDPKHPRKAGLQIIIECSGNLEQEPAMHFLINKYALEEYHKETKK